MTDVTFTDVTPGLKKKITALRLKASPVSLIWCLLPGLSSVTPGTTPTSDDMGSWSAPAYLCNKVKGRGQQ